MIKIKKTIYITPEVAGILEYEQKKTGMKMSDLINKKLYASLEDANANNEKIIEKLIFEIQKLSIVQKRQLNNEEYLKNFLEFLWASLHIQNVGSLTSCESLQSLKASLNQLNHND